MRKAANATPNYRLRRARQQRGWSLKHVADLLDTDAKAVGRWERGTIFPSPHYRQKLCELFDLTAVELGFMPEEVAGTLPSGTGVPTAPIWNVPYRRNPFFTACETLLTRLYETFHAGRTVASSYPQALCGLGGIGKTQTAVEYAYRYHDEYQAVLWVNADSYAGLVADVVAIADLLDLPEKGEQNQGRVVAAVKQWLQRQAHWLLILDNVEELEMVNDFLPVLSQGHILLTCRAQVTGAMAQRIIIEKMRPEEGALLLLRRAKLVEPETVPDELAFAEWAKARTIAELMDGLPLALDQAGAYIEETARSLSEYLDLYQRQQSTLLRERGRAMGDHPEPVATTWSLSFKKVQEANPAAADLLRLCAFLHPDAIPEEMLAEGAVELSPILQPVTTDPLKLASAIQELRKYSLVRRNPEANTLTVHRLVQAVLKEGMDEDTQYQWAERAVRAVNRVFPDGEFATWHRCERCLPQTQVCATLIGQWKMRFTEAAHLLNRVGKYLQERGRYSEAEPLLKQALDIYEQALGAEHLDVAESLSDLATVYSKQDKYAQAETLNQRSLAIREKLLEPEHPKVASSLNNLALLYQEEGEYIQAELLYQRVLAIYEHTLGPEHSEVAISLNNLALVYEKQGKYAEAEALNRRSLAIRQKNLGAEHPGVATSLNNLALVCEKQGKYTEAETLFQQALAILGKTLGPEHPNVASSLSNLADVYRALGKYAEAESLHLQALAIREKLLGPTHHHVAFSLNKLARLYAQQGKYAQAKPLYQRALTIREKALGAKHPEVARTLSGLAEVYRDMGKYARAEMLYKRALAIWEQTLGREHPEVATALANYAELLRKMNRETEAAGLET